MKNLLALLTLFFLFSCAQTPSRKTASTDCSKAVNKKLKECTGRWNDGYHRGGGRI